MKDRAGKIMQHIADEGNAKAKQSDNPKMVVSFWFHFECQLNELQYFEKANIDVDDGATRAGASLSAWCTSNNTKMTNTCLAPHCLHTVL